MSASKNHDDQPKLCYVCDGRILSTMSAQFYYDDTKAKAHWSRHNACRAGVR